MQVTYRFIGLLLGLGLMSLSAQTVHVVTNQGLSFDPDAITVMAGDTIDFQISSNHNAVQVSQATYDTNGDSPLDGGFSVGFGGGKIALDSVGTFYYVCTPHAGAGMKGTITVQPATTSLAEALPRVPVRLLTLAGAGQYELRLHSEAPAAATLHVLDLAGRRVQQRALSLRRGETAISLDLNKLPVGSYLVELQRVGFAPTQVRIRR